ncbi:MAG: DUF502 domain-containing protein [Planctomycetota bacterium]|jgi:uncharacterized membrane protein
MKRILRYFFQGLLVLMPTGLTIYIVSYVVVHIDGWVCGLLDRIHILDAICPGQAWRGQGLGVPLALAVVVIAGWLMDIWVFRKIWGLLDRTLEKLPFVKSVYGAIRDTMVFLFGEKKSFSKVVLVTLPGSDHGVMGMVTNEDPSREAGANVKGRLGVYVPMAFNLGGYTLYVDKGEVTPVDMPPEDAMSFILSGGVSRQSVEEEGG